MSDNSLETILKNKINLFGEYLITQCNDTNKQNEIRQALTDLPTYKVLLFISFIDHNKIDTQITEFIKIFSINDTQETRNEMKKHIEYFLEVKKILNNKS
jgi:hypothetical protein